MLSSILACAVLSQGQFKALPPTVILRSAGEQFLMIDLLNFGEKVKAIRTWQESDKNFLCFRPSDSTYLFVTKNYPAFQKLRFRRHVVGLFEKYGLAKAFTWQEVSRDFKNESEAIWRNDLTYVPRDTTKFKFQLMLTTSTTVNGRPREASFAPSQKAPELTEELKASPGFILTKREDMTNRAKAIDFGKPEPSFYVPLQTTVAQETNVVKDALEQFRGFYDEQVNLLDAKVEALLTDPKFDGLKARRKCRTMTDLKQQAPREYKGVKSLMSGSAEDGDLLTEQELASLELAPLNHQYMLIMVGYGTDGKGYECSLPF
jgi:hypothetical protein